MSSIIFAKLAPDFFRNRKVMKAGRDGALVFLAALCMNADRGAPGWIPAADLEPWFIARYLGWCSEQEARNGVTAAVDAKLLIMDGDRVLIAGWDAEWSRRAKTRSEIQKDYRARKQSPGDERYVDSVTSDDQSNALPIRGEERRGERGASNAPGSLSASLIPEDWAPATEAVALAAELGLDVRQEATKFADRMRSGERDGKRRKSSDWHAEFRTWLRRGADFQERNGKRKAKPGATRIAPVVDIVFGASEQGLISGANEPRKAKA